MGKRPWSADSFGNFGVLLYMYLSLYIYVLACVAMVELVELARSATDEGTRSTSVFVSRVSDICFLLGCLTLRCSFLY